MATDKIHYPEPTEYLPYYGKYISLVQKGDILETLQQQNHTTLDLLRGLSEQQGAHRYAPEKWTIKEVVGHVTDTERIFVYRALRFARNDKKELQGFDENPYVQFANFNNCKLSDLTDEFECVRHSTLYLLKHLSEEAWTRRGVASGAEVSVRALAYIVAGHELHHVNILKTRYL
jgi:uncharacterized damage-inducible protein DinB